MATNNYNPYNYPYQQSSAQQYSSYQTAPAPNNNVSQSSRQYQSTPSTSQSNEYMSYQAPSYNNQRSAYGAAQDDTWGSSSYGGSRETTSRAAEVLRNMSNTTYTSSNSTAVSQPGFTATNTVAAHYPNSGSQTHTHQAPQPQASVPAYGQSQVRPRSVNANKVQGSTSRVVTSPAMAAGYPSQRASTAYNQQPQRSASPAQSQYDHDLQTFAKNTGTQYTEYNNRQLPNLDATRSTTATSSSYSYDDTHASAPLKRPTANNGGDKFNQGTITVDPMAVYDPWPEYQRKQEAIRAQKAVEDAAKAEEQRVTEETRKEEERAKEEERRQQEEKDRARQASTHKSKQKGRKSQPAANSEVDSLMDAGDIEGPIGEGMEAEIRALMAKMREFNSKDPAMLARIWEEERRAKAPKSPTVTTGPAPAPAPITPQLAQTSAPQTANQRKKVSSAREMPAAAIVKPATPLATGLRSSATPVASTRTGGNTIWPPEKKATLAAAATTYLNEQNPMMPLQPHQILAMLDGNPSYIELCEQLEAMGIKLDRAAFAKNLLTAVPDVNSSSRAKATQAPGNGVVRPVPVAPPAVMKRDIGTPPVPAVGPASSAPSPVYPRSSELRASAAFTPMHVAEMVPIKPELKRPANKEEAARKRNFNDLIDLTQADEDDLDPPLKRVFAESTYSPASAEYMNPDAGPTNFPMPAPTPPQLAVHPTPPPMPPVNLRHAEIVEPVDRRKALRRNTYNIKTIARDVLLACGRHPETRWLNQHLEILRTTYNVQQDADLSTLKWDLIDPGTPPRGYFKDNVQGVEEDAEKRKKQGSGLPSSDGASHSVIRAQLPAEAINPFKPKKRGRPPRNSFGPDQTTLSTPTRLIPKAMSASLPRAGSEGIGYAAFRSATQYDANGDLLPKKRGRPVGWRKKIHGSAQANEQPAPHDIKFKPSQPSMLRSVNSGDTEYIRINSNSPGVPNKTRNCKFFECKWKGCKAELHNLQTLKMHVNKVHRLSTNDQGFLECHWADCATEATNQDAMTGMRPEHRLPKSFTTIAKWLQHMEQVHFSPLAWELGDGPASGVSGLHILPSLHAHADVNRLSRYDRLGGISK